MLGAALEGWVPCLPPAWPTTLPVAAGGIRAQGLPGTASPVAGPSPPGTQWYVCPITWGSSRPLRLLPRAQNHSEGLCVMLGRVLHAQKQSSLMTHGAYAHRTQPGATRGPHERHRALGDSLSNPELLKGMQLHAKPGWAHTMGTGSAGCQGDGAELRCSTLHGVESVSGRP